MLQKIINEHSFSKTLVLLISFLMPIQVLAWGAPTHYAITKLALEEKADNLNFFLKTFGLEGNLPKEADQSIEPCSLEGYLQDKDGFYNKELHFLIEDCTANGLIEAGAVLEDNPSTNAVNHFYDPQNERAMFTGKKAWEWATTEQFFGFSWKKAVDEYFKTAIVGEKPEDRMRGKEKLFVTVGHVVHLLEDMSQPAHTRNDSHLPPRLGIVTGNPFGDPNELELWAKNEVSHEKYGTENMSYCSLSSGPLRMAIQAEQAKPEPQKTTVKDYFVELAKFSNAEFFSDDNILNKLGEFPTPSPETIELRDEETFVTISTFLVSISTGLSEIDDLNNKSTGQTKTKPRLARKNRGLSLYVSLPKTATGVETTSTGVVGSMYTMQDSRNLVLQDNARVLIPKAVVYARAIVNHFFRGKFELKVDKDNPNQLQVKNLSQESNSLDGKMQLFYKTQGGKVLPLQPLGGIPIVGDLLSGVDVKLNVGESQPVKLDKDVSTILEEKRQQSCPDDKDNCPREDSCVIAYFKGKIGEEDGVAAAQTSIPGNMSVLLVFDVSLSMEGKIGKAQSAGLDLLTSLEKGKNNRVAIHSFNKSVSAPGFTNDIQAAKAKIPSSLGEYTALYDAMVAAGSVAAEEAEAHPENKVVVVLYTDGEENASGSSHEQAVNALYSSPKIKVLFVYGGDYSGAVGLQNIAAQTGQESSTISSFDQLGTEFSRAMGGCQDDNGGSGS